MGERSGSAPRVLVVTTSDQAAAGLREDESGRLVAERLAALGWRVERRVVADDEERIADLLRAAADRYELVVTTGGTGLTPRDVTPQATLAVVDYLVPGLAELMRLEGLRRTPFAALSRGVAGVRGRCLIVNLPGSPTGAGESLAAILPVLPHALETLAGPFDHGRRRPAGLEGVAGGPGTDAPDHGPTSAGDPNPGGSPDAAVGASSGDLGRATAGDEPSR
jgi:molybdopterin adenylyltransferase